MNVLKDKLAKIEALKNDLETTRQEASAVQAWCTHKPFLKRSGLEAHSHRYTCKRVIDMNFFPR